MQVGQQRYQSEGARGIARFLTEHKDHDGGFDVRRVAGSNGTKLRVTCEGCGESYEHQGGRAAPAHHELLRAPRTWEGAPGGNGSQRAAGEPATSRSAGNGQRGSRRGVRAPSGAATTATRERRFDSRALPGWAWTALVAALIGGGLAMVGAGILGSDDQRAAPEEPTAASSQSLPEAAPAEVGEAATGGLRRRTFAGSFSIGVPSGWRTGTEGAAITIAAPGSKAELSVYFEHGARPDNELARDTRAFLRRRHPGTQVRRPQVGIDGGRRWMEAKYPGGSELAVTTVSGGYSYLILKRVERDAPPRIESEAEAALASFEPR